MPEYLGGIPLLDTLHRAHRERLAGAARSVRIGAHQRLFDEGQPAAGCWLIRSGRVALDTVVPGRGTMVLQTLGAGDVLGWSWLSPARRWRCGAVALTPVDAVYLDADALSELMASEPEFGLAVVTALVPKLVEGLHSTRARLLDMHGNPRER